MSGAPRVAPADVVALLAERHKYEQWLQALEGRRTAATPRHVLDRVRADYEARLQAVQEQLANHRSELEQRVESLAARLAKLEDDEHSRRDERTELALRCDVGELAPAAFEGAARECDRVIAEVAAESAAVREELQRTRDVLRASAGEQRLAPEPPPSPPSPAAPAAPAPRGIEAKAAAASRSSNFDELAFLNTVISDVPERSERAEIAAASVADGSSATAHQPAPSTAAAGTTAPEPSSPPTVAAPDAQPDRSAGADDIYHEEATLGAESLVSRAHRPSIADWQREDSSGTFEPGILSAPDSPGGGEGGRKSGSVTPPFAQNVTGNNPIVLRPSGPVEQSKVLKCSDCGAMNYPTEWYCERCGAELASL